MKDLKLSTLKPLFIGDSKIVYQSPINPDEFIKIPKGNELSFQKFRRLPTYWEFANEIIEYLSIREREQENAHFIENVKGLVDTDIGVGMVVEAIKSPDGKAAPTIKSLMSSKQITTAQASAFERLISWAKQTDTIIREFTTTNSVWNHETESFVVIDGLGCKPFFSLRPYSKTYNRRSNRKKAEKLVQRTGGFRASE